MSNAVFEFRTHREAVRFTLEWTIENFRSFRNETESMYSPAITMAELGLQDDYDGCWSISVLPCFKRSSDDTKRFFSVHLRLSDMGNESNDTDMDEEVDVESDTDEESHKKLGTNIEASSDSGTDRNSHKESELELKTKKRKQSDYASDIDNKPTSSPTEQEVLAEFTPRITTGKTLQKEIWSTKDPEVRTFTSAKKGWGWEEAVSHGHLFGSDKKAAWLKDDCVTVSFDVVIYKQPQNIQFPKTIVVSTGDRRQNFTTRQLNWFISQQQSKSRELDFILRSSDGKEFHASRWILMVHSAVFAAMLNHDSKEAKTSHCEMVDVDGETTEVMLSYMYGCSMEKVNKGNAEKVLIMADKYQMMDLLYACEELLADNVTTDQAVYLLVFATQRGLEKLKTAALNVIPKNMALVLKNGALEEALQADPYLMETIMEHCSKKMRIIDEA